jgi:hypothetical protein
MDLFNTRVGITFRFWILRPSASGRAGALVLREPRRISRGNSGFITPIMIRRAY